MPHASMYGARLYDKVAATVVGRRKKFRFKNKLVSIDSTVIDVSLSMFDWANYQRTKGAVKLHLVLDNDGYLPCFGVVTDGKVHDVKVAQELHFAPGTVVVDDRGYNDYALFGLHRTLGLNIPQSQLVVGIRGYTLPEDNNVRNALLMPFRKQRDYWRRPDGSVVERDGTAAGQDPTRLAEQANFQQGSRDDPFRSAHACGLFP